MSSYFDNKNPLFMEPTVTQYGSHMVMTNVSKPILIRYLNIDSRFRDDNETKQLANYNITLPERVLNVKTVKVMNMEIPITFYNISANLGNNCFTIKIKGSLSECKTIILPDTQYDSTSFVTAINVELAALGSPYNNIIFSVVDNFCVFNNTDPTNDFIIDFAVNDQGIADIQNVTFKLGWLMGFRNANKHASRSFPTKFCKSYEEVPQEFREMSYILPSASVLKSIAFLDLNGPRYLYLIMDEYQNYNPLAFISLLKTSEMNKFVLARISLSKQDYPYGTVMSTTDSIGKLLTSYRIYLGAVDIQKMNIKLVNERGVVMDLNGLDFSFAMKLECE